MPRCSGASGDLGRRRRCRNTNRHTRRLRIMIKSWSLHRSCKLPFSRAVRTPLVVRCYAQCARRFESYRPRYFLTLRGRGRAWYLDTLEVKASHSNYGAFLRHNTRRAGPRHMPSMPSSFTKNHARHAADGAHSDTATRGVLVCAYLRPRRVQLPPARWVPGPRRGRVIDSCRRAPSSVAPSRYAPTRG